MTRRLRLAVLAFLVATAITSLAASPQRAVTSGANDAPLTATVPVDPRITVGTLSNGLRYYIRANKQPQDRAELRLVVNAGSVLEDDDQRGLAHFVEHMAFNGTRHFPKQDVVAFLQSTGMRFGAHINANTSFDQTVYQLQIPTDKPGRHRPLAADPGGLGRTPSRSSREEIDKERGVILEEWRTGLGADARMLDAAAAGPAQGLPLRRSAADRQAGDHPQPSRTTRLKKFYTDWYRPDLMAVIAVGDFDPAAIEALIKSHFARDSGAGRRRGRGRSTTCPIIRARATRSRPTPKRPRPPSASPARWPRATRRPSAPTASRRSSGCSPACCRPGFAEMAQKPDAPFLDADTNRGDLRQSAEATTLNALVRDGGVEKGLAALFTEADRVARFGFTADRAGSLPAVDCCRRFEQLAASNDEHTSRIAGRRIHPQLPAAGADSRHRLRVRAGPALPARDHAGRRQRAGRATGCPIATASSPSVRRRKPASRCRTRRRWRPSSRARGQRALTAYVDTVSARPLLETAAEAGRGRPRPRPRPPGITEWTLSNGVRVVLEPTTFKQDEILFRAFSPGGTSLASDSDFVAAETADQVVTQGGLGELSAIDAEQEAGGQGGGRPTRHRGDVRGPERPGAARDDLETMFQLIYLTFTQPRADPEAFRAMTGQLTGGAGQPAGAARSGLRGRADRRGQPEPPSGRVR